MLVNLGGKCGNADADNTGCSQAYWPDLDCSASDEAVDATFTGGLYGGGVNLSAGYASGEPQFIDDRPDNDGGAADIPTHNTVADIRRDNYS